LTRVPVGSYYGGWFTRLVMGRVNTQNNCLIIIEGETGSGKSCMGLSLAQHFDPYFSTKRIVFSAQEFLDLLPNVPNKGWLMWDEVGVWLSHRKWQSEVNFQIMQVIQSFRYKFINVIFCLPSASYMDKVVREMCHFVIRLQRRGVGAAYRICKTPYQGWTFTPYLGNIHSEMPTAGLWNEFRRLHSEHQERLYEQSRKGLTVQEKRKAEQLEKALKPKQPFEELLEKARLILPQIVDNSRATAQGRINVPEMRRLLKIPHNTAYNLRKELLKELEATKPSTPTELSSRQRGERRG
jgi:ABC-type dipeptide/oligopeptide/nickel transport system ATPase component